ncbi:hypothetical protein JW865_09380 [Candidatus Bathyarchaeota archaeon]|nr:hypothetical protein [Candidatus Bathyarchaeota archaeon]
MTGKDILRTVQHILRDKGIDISIEQFNRYYALANEELKRTVYGLVGDPSGFETEGQIKDELHPFISSTSLYPTAGLVNLPVDYWHKITATVADSGVEIKFVTSEEALRKNNNSITAPSLKYPIAELTASKLKVYPTSIDEIDFVYLKIGNKPSVSTKLENGIMVYDTVNSTEPNFNKDKFIDLIRIIVSYLSVPISPEQVLSYMEQKNERVSK